MKYAVLTTGNTINRITLVAEIAASMVRTLTCDRALFRHQRVFVANNSKQAQFQILRDGTNDISP